MQRMKTTCSARVAIGCVGMFLATGVAAQGLSLTYELDVQRDSAQNVSVTPPRCAGLYWLSSTLACGQEPLATTTSAMALDSHRGEGASDSGHSAGTRRATAAAGAPVASLRDASQLPAESAAEARLRPAAAARALDVSLRFGSQSRLRALEESREAARFADVAYESHLHTNAHKAVGLELLVPFQ